MTSSPFPTDWVLEHASRNPDAPAVDGPWVRLTYGALASRVGALAAHLAERGVRPDDFVVVALPTSPASVVAALAVHALGACVVEIDRAMGKDGLQTVIAQARPRYAVISKQDAAAWTEAMDGALLEWAWTLGPARGPATVPARGTTSLSNDGLLPPEARGLTPPPGPGVDQDAPALVLYTSGSTGKPRGVVQTFRNIAANTRSIVEYAGLGPSDRVMAILPFYYTFGRSLLQTHLYAGGSTFIDPRFMYPRVVIEALATERCTGFAGVPMTYEILRREVDVAAFPREALRYLMQAGGPMRADTIRWVRQAFAPARLFVMYGQTEATARLSYVPPERGEEKLGSIGVPIPGVELAVVDDQGTRLSDGSVGHLVARGDNVTRGYLAAPADTAAILRGGWLWTGDLARRDGDGFFWLEGRAKEILKVSGYRVSPVEIEHVLAEAPGVAEAAVVGAPDPLQGEVAIAFVVPRNGTAVQEQELRRFCKDRLAPYKVPSRVVTIDAIPRNDSGKPLKKELASRAAAAWAAGETR